LDFNSTLSTLSTFEKGGAKHHNPFWFYLFHLSTFQKSRAKQPLRKVVPKMFGSTFSKGGIKKLNLFSLYY
jgi:hypothetical protein